MARGRSSGRGRSRSRGRSRRSSGKKWIGKAIKRPGALRSKLPKTKSGKIKASALKPKKGDSTRTKRQKALARTLRKMNRKKK